VLLLRGSSEKFAKAGKCEEVTMEDEQLAADEAAAYQRELELQWLEREELKELDPWEVTEGAF
jgi:hypothetical protein